MTAGRPTDYSEEVLEKAKDYLENYQSQGDLVPSIAGLADVLGKHRDTMYAWAKDEDKQEFSDTLSKIEMRQHRRLLSGGLGGEMNAAIVKLMLHNHGYSDKQDSTLSGPGGAPIEVDQYWQVEFINPTDADPKS